MRPVAFVLVNVLLVLAWWRCLRGPLGLTRPEAAAYAGLLVALQLVSSQLLLGAVGLLQLPWLLALLAPVTAAVAAWSPGARPGAVTPGAARALLQPANAALAILVLAYAAWLALATWLLPPRGVDDLAYHLPPLYQYAQTGRIELLPLELRTQFAMPLGGDFLFLWPLVFLGEDTWIDGVSFVVAAWSAITLYALARALGATRADALCAALLLLLTPVVMAQSGANYNDLAILASHLVLLYAALRFWQTGRLLHLVMAGLAGGFGLGVKYNMLLALALAQPLLLAAAWRHRGRLAPARGYALYLAATLAVPAWWLLRNALVTGEPLYPYVLGPSGLHSFGTVPEEIVIEEGSVGLGSALGKLLEDPGRLLLYLLRDPGLGSLNGGFGLAFWACGLPALGWCLLRAFRALRAGDPLPLLFWGVAPVLFVLFLLQMDITRLPYNMRLAMVVVALGFAALALVFARLRSELPGAAGAVQALCVAAAALALVHLAGSRIPTFDVGAALADRAAGTATGPQRYYREAQGDLAALAVAFEPLDWLTRGGSGWDVYMAADWRVFVTAPLYGSGLQNRVWNFRPEPRAAPDALVYHKGFGRTTGLFYVRGEIPPERTRADPRYELIAWQAATELWVAGERLADPATGERLAEFYRRRNAADIAAATQVAAGLPEADLIVGSDSLVNGFRYLALTGALATPAYLSRPGEEAALAAARGARRVISVGAPLAGASSRVVAEVATPLGRVALHLNEIAS